MRRFYAILYIMSSGNPETRKRILETAWRLMVDHHGKDVWVDEIARETRLSRQSIYLYFKNRADLLIATVRYVDEVKEVNHRLEVVAEPADELGSDGGAVRRGDMKPFTRFAWAVLAYNLAVIAWGVYVRATRSGAGCGAHWPLCNGEVVPQAPSVEMLVEFTHRVSSGLALLSVAALLIESASRRRMRNSLPYAPPT